jgi:hypothetical protein
MCGGDPIPLLRSLFEHTLPRFNGLLAVDVKVYCHVRIGHLYRFGVDNIAP